MAPFFYFCNTYDVRYHFDELERRVTRINPDVRVLNLGYSATGVQDHAFKRLAPEFGVGIIDFSDVAYTKAYGDSARIPFDLHSSETGNMVHTALINNEIKRRISDN